MDRHFLLPASVAAALHIGLLFGYRPEHVPAPMRSVLIPIFCDPPPEVFEVDLKRPDEVPDAQPAAPASGEPRPVAPEPPAEPGLSGFLIQVPATPPMDPRAIVSKIPLGPIGPSSDLPLGPGVGDRVILRSGDLDNSPRTRTQASPVYPFEAKRDGRSGTVMVEFTVDESGGVVSPHVVESSDRVFEESALRAVTKWRFEPGRRDGRVVRFRMAVPIVFSLNGD